MFSVRQVCQYGEQHARHGVTYGDRCAVRCVSTDILLIGLDVSVGVLSGRCEGEDGHDGGGKDC